ncbi:hypothetical protein CTI12_AA271320 [Artemisia annua]|uniref:Uncharacterized protein n=1 Tax=Artemisia annua TaxID=35608 RepID=A0A2U1NG83_ARTAN|nr:hypothetical protein CTI12_AA271320 [Artemisia annua]
MANKDWSKVTLTEDMTDYLYEKYKNNRKVGDDVSDEMLDNLWNYPMVKGISKGPSDVFQTLEDVFGYTKKTWRETKQRRIKVCGLRFVNDCGSWMPSCVKDNMQHLPESKGSQVCIQLTMLVFDERSCQRRYNPVRVSIHSSCTSMKQSFILKLCGIRVYKSQLLL